MESWKFAFQILQFLLTGGLAIYVYLSNKDKVTNDRITTLEGNINDTSGNHGQRIAKLEARIDKSPTHDDLANLHEKINEVSGQMKELRGEFSGARNTLQLIHETLMERK